MEGKAVDMLLEAAVKFYQDPENMRAYEEWKAKREREGDSDGHIA